jgi:flagellar biogenesis protein FliO
MNHRLGIACIATVALALLLGSIAPSALAQPAPDASQRSYLDEDETSPTSPELPSMGSALVRLIAVMALLFALLFGGIVLFQKIARRGLTVGGGSRPLRIVDRVSLGPKSSVCLVQTCGKALVLGVSEKEISVLLDMDLASQEGKNADFAGTLQRISDAPNDPSGQSPA